MYDHAKAELSGEGKFNHWIWYIFPQLIGPGKSPNSKKYDIKNANEAIWYMANNTLNTRYLELVDIIYMKLVTDAKPKNPMQYMGGDGGDAYKLRSSLELFNPILRSDKITEIITKILSKLPHYTR